MSARPAPKPARTPTTPRTRRRIRARRLGAVLGLAAVLGTSSCVTAPPTTPIAGGITVPEALVSDAPSFAVAHAMVRFRTQMCDGVFTGSGFAIDEHRIITNRHVIGGADIIQAETWDGRLLEVTDSRISPDTDLAVVTVSEPLKDTLDLGDAEPAGGTSIDVVGYPLGNALRFDEGTALQVINGEDYGNERVVMIDAKVRHGNSGGPIVDANGVVVGVVFRYMSGATETGLAIPVTTLKDHLAEDRFVDNPGCEAYLEEYGYL